MLRDLKELVTMSLHIFKGSAGEIRSQLYRSLDYQIIDKEKLDELHLLSDLWRSSGIQQSAGWA